MKWIKRISIFILIALVGIQFFPAKRNQSTIILESDFTKTYAVPIEVQTVLATSCYDCHSNNTNYPWYNKIQPVAWLLENHINEGKAELNFSEFGNYSKRRKKNKLKSIISQIKDDDMPLSTYTIIHGDAILTEQEKTTIISWLNQNVN